MPLSRIVFLTGTLVLAGCTMSPDYERPEVVTPPDWSVAAGEDGGAVNASDPAWWSHFGSAELDRLIARAFDANTDLAASIHRVAQARASVRVAGAALLPAVDAGGSLSRDWNEPFSNASDGVSGWSSQVGVSYELDFWGRNRAAIDAASAQLDATVYDHETLRLVVAADVGLTYAEALTINDQLRLTREQRDNARGILELVEARFEAGAVSGLELAQQRTELANFDARIAALVRQREAAANRLAVLIGEAPQSFARPTGTLASLAVPDMAADPPAVLLTRRPDLRRAEAELVAAHADIGAARAAFFPSFRLGADLAAGARPISAATDTVAGIAASVVAPIFSGGRLEGNVERSRAVRDELVERYRRAVLVSFQEAEDALVTLGTADTRLDAFARAVEQARIAYRISRDRFDAGSIDFLSLLDAQRSLLQAEESLTLAQLDKISAAIQLFRAMGGGWSGNLNAAPKRPIF